MIKVPHIFLLSLYMPKIFKYLGIVIFFHSREHLPIHVHGRLGGNENKAEIIIENGQIIDIRFRKVTGKNPLRKKQMEHFHKFVEEYKQEIVDKWVAYFVYNEKMEIEEINQEL